MARTASSMAIGLAWLVALSGCATSHAIRPLPRGAGAVTASLGGPINTDLATMPLPLTTIGYAHGLTERTTLHAAVHPTLLIGFGVLGVDAGVAHRLVPPSQWRPRLMVDADVVVMGGRQPRSDAAGGSALFADVQLIASWDLGDHAIYGGVDQIAQIAPSARYRVSPLAGVLVGVGRTRVMFEYMWMAPQLDSTLATAQFVGPFGRGAHGIKLGLAFQTKEGS